MKTTPEWEAELSRWIAIFKDHSRTGALDQELFKQFMRSTINCIKQEFMRAIPEEESVPSEEDDAAIHNWSKGYNDAIQEFKRRVEGL